MWTHLHEEDCSLDWAPGDRLRDDKDPFESNQALPYLVFQRHWEAIQARVPSLRLVSIDLLSFFSYVLCGGFTSRSLLLGWAYRAVTGFENGTRRLWTPVAALRALIVVERA